MSFRFLFVVVVVVVPASFNIFVLLMLGLFACSWVFMAEGEMSYWGGDGLTMMGAYGTMPMMINL